MAQISFHTFTGLVLIQGPVHGSKVLVQVLGLNLKSLKSHSHGKHTNSHKISNPGLIFYETEMALDRTHSFAFVTLIMIGHRETA